jgi:hypothetical protein
MLFMGWTWDAYQRTPIEVVHTIVRRMNAEYERYGVTKGVVYSLQILPKE